MGEARTEFDWGVIFRALLCLFLGGGFVLFVLNNDLLRHGFPVLANPEVLIMLALLGVPFLFAVVHLIRSLSNRHPGEREADNPLRLRAPQINSSLRPNVSNSSCSKALAMISL